MAYVMHSVRPRSICDTSTSSLTSARHAKLDAVHRVTFVLAFGVQPKQRRLLTDYPALSDQHSFCSLYARYFDIQRAYTRSILEAMTVGIYGVRLLTALARTYFAFYEHIACIFGISARTFAGRRIIDNRLLSKA